MGPLRPAGKQAPQTALSILWTYEDLAFSRLSGTRGQMGMGAEVRRGAVIVERTGYTAALVSFAVLRMACPEEGPKTNMKASTWKLAILRR
jgi:hypothetical protein